MPAVSLFILLSAGLSAAGAPSGPSSALGSTSAVPAATRNPRWAAALSEPGLRNLYRVSPTLYRGAQPSAEGMRSLRKLGVRTVVSLRAFHGERRLVESADLVYRRISFAIWHPETSDMIEFLEVVRDPARQPVFVHCMRGADRTGLAVAVYRVCVEGWTPAEAREEMLGGGYGYERRFRHIERHLLSIDAETCAVRVAAALAGGPGASAAD